MSPGQRLIDINLELSNILLSKDANTGQSWILCRSSQQLVPRGSELEVSQIIVVCNDKAESGSVAQLQRGRRNEVECHSFVELLECGAGAVGDCLGAILFAGALVPWLEQTEGLTYTLALTRRTDSRHAENGRSEEHTSELQSLMRISYAVFCLKKKKKQTNEKTS